MPVEMEFYSIILLVGIVQFNGVHGLDGEYFVSYGASDALQML